MNRWDRRLLVLAGLIVAAGLVVVAARYNWLAPAAITASALATLGLAVFTARMASKTSAMAEAARDEADAVLEQSKSVAKQAGVASDQLALTRRSFEASVQPWLTVGENQDGSPMTTPILVRQMKTGGLLASLAIRNVGTGLAIVDAPNSHLVGWSNPGSGTLPELMEFDPGTILNPVLPPGEQQRLHFEVDLNRWLNTFEAITGRNQGRNGNLWFDVIYRDVLGYTTTRARFEVGRSNSNYWFATAIDYFSPPDASEASPRIRMQ